MPSLPRTHTEQPKWTSKRKGGSPRVCRGGECPVAGAGAPGSGAPRILFPTAFAIDFLRFEVHFSRSVRVPRRDSTSAHVWYGLQTNLDYHFRQRQSPCKLKKTQIGTFSFFLDKKVSSSLFFLTSTKNIVEISIESLQG